MGADFPFDGDVRGITSFLRVGAERGDQRPFGHWVILRIADGRAIGGIGFKNRAPDGCVELGYGLVPSARGNGYAAEAVQALLDVARKHGVLRVLADTDVANIPSQRTLEHAGFVRTHSDGDLLVYAVDLSW